MSDMFGTSRLVLGLWRIARTKPDRATLIELINASLDSGIDCFDLADVYGGYLCEAQFGDALAASGIRREAVRIVSKCGIRGVSSERPENKIKHYDNSGAYITRCIDLSLKALRTEYLDLMLLHRPDFLLDADAAATALDAAIRAGKIRHAGVSNFGVTQCELLAARMPGRVAANQIEFSVLKRDALSDGTLDWCQMAGCVPMAWSPLGGGALFTGESTELVRLRAALAAVGREHGGAALEQIALAWLLRHPARVVPVLGTSTPQRVRDAARAATLSLSRQQWYLILEAATGSPVP